MISFKKKYFIVIFSLILVISSFYASFYLGFIYGKKSVHCEHCPPNDVNFSLFWEAYDVLKQNYVNTGKIINKDVLYGAISGMVNSLKDPYTVFMSPEDSKMFLEDVQGEFEGVGMEIGIKDDQLQVISPLDGTPAQKAGIMAGDKILYIDGEPTAKMTLEEAVKKIRGKKGTKVTLTIMRESWAKPKDFEIVRGIIKIPTIKWEIKNEDIAYIKIYEFSETASSDFRKAAIKIVSNPKVKKIVLDLRNNPGGYLEVARDIAGWFLKPGELVVVEDFEGKRENIDYRTYGNGAFLHYPVVVLINKGSASASEILAAALRDNRGIKLIGEKSFGKGSVQQLFPLDDGSNLKITVAKWLTPKGGSIDGKGLEPDIEVKMTEKDYQEGRDPQLKRALEIINNYEEESKSNITERY